MYSLQDFVKVTAPADENIQNNYNNIRINSRGLISIDNNYNILDNNGEILFTIPFRITISKQLKLNVMQLKGGTDYKAYYRYKQYGLKDIITQIYQGWLYEYQEDLIKFLYKRK